MLSQISSVPKFQFTEPRGHLIFRCLYHSNAIQILKYLSQHPISIFNHRLLRKSLLGIVQYEHLF